MKTTAISLLITIILVYMQKAPADDDMLSRLNWMSGHWSARVEGIQMEEYWMPASGGIMLGLHRDVFPNGNSFFEYLRIADIADTVRYIASPRGGSSTEFFLKSIEKYNVVFENIEHDFPQRIIYSLNNDTTLHARIEGEVDGEMRHQEWKWFKSNYQ